ncbi:putative dehydrogenase [Lipingzhangella halophila]|uniref:Putative dehydrogenase n=1 Tax=Lipingzhangella halophila TaxID=1783352 RepID=A0A7W7RHU7_9ACTN|nr:DUF6807 family protein [Lipingzhangella halophila]MBB4932167.1 putative dehydrogenase [Lipingzhangella halophila]
MNEVTVALAGIHGHGRSHLARLLRLSESETGHRPVRLVGVCDRVPPTTPLVTPKGEVAYDSDLGALLERTGAEVTLLATPIHTHVPLARTALGYGAHLLVEKPPTASLAEFEELRAAVREQGAACQVGFQSLGSAAIPAARALVARGAIGEVQGVSGAGTWVRTSAYFERADWAGRRRLDGHDVVDGALTNPFAHAVATALAVAEAGHAPATGIELELFRAHDIESDDTACLRLRTAAGVPVTIAVTLCAATSTRPEVTVHGSAGTLTLAYKDDTLTLRQVGRAPVTTEHSSTDLLENLTAHLRSGEPLLCPLESVTGVMSVVEAVRRAPAPRPIPAAHQRVVADSDGVRRIVTGVDTAVAQSAARLALFSEVGAPWAARRALRHPERAAGPALADHNDGSDLDTRLSPRPYLHPVRTRSGTVVSEVLPADHPHHLGVGLAIAAVSGVNFWGGRTFVRGRGPALLADHGRQDHIAWLRDEGGALAEELTWLSPGGRELLHEERVWAAHDVGTETWALELGTRLRNTSGAELVIDSPATKGRPGAGYGGFFWRAPAAAAAPRCFGPGADTEQDLHGSTAGWLAMASACGRWTLCFHQPGPERDPWFLRAAEYPGVGTALAWERPLRVAAGDELRRTLVVLVCDGAPGAETLAGLIERVGGLRAGPRAASS